MCPEVTYLTERHFAHSPFTQKLQSLSLDLFLQILLFQVVFLIFCALLLFLLVGLLLLYVALCQSGN